MNTFGQIFRCTTWGESHGEAVGCVVDGCPAGMELDDNDILRELDRDIPDSDLGTPRREANQIKIMSGIFEKKTLGTPICIMIPNSNRRSNDYEKMRYYYRPGHAEYTYHKKYGIYNPYGGSRASGRECIARLAGGAVAKKILALNGVTFESRVEELAGVNSGSQDEQRAAKVKCMDIGIRGDSTGGILSLCIKGIPAGVGNPVFGKLHALIVFGLSTIGGVKGVECGLGFEAARMMGSEFNDQFGIIDNQIKPLTNNAGGVLGGISTGNDLVFRLAVKPTPSIKVEQKTVNWDSMQEETLTLDGRFDKNFTPRVGPIAEAMAAMVIVDQMILSGYINPARIN